MVKSIIICKYSYSPPIDIRNDNVGNQLVSWKHYPCRDSLLLVLYPTQEMELNIPSLRIRIFYKTTILAEIDVGSLYKNDQNNHEIPPFVAIARFPNLGFKYYVQNKVCRLQIKFPNENQYQIALNELKQFGCIVKSSFSNNSVSQSQLSNGQQNIPSGGNIMYRNQQEYNSSSQNIHNTIYFRDNIEKPTQSLNTLNQSSNFDLASSQPVYNFDSTELLKNKNDLRMNTFIPEYPILNTGHDLENNINEFKNKNDLEYIQNTRNPCTQPSLFQITTEQSSLSNTHSIVNDKIKIGNSKNTIIDPPFYKNSNDNNLIDIPNDSDSNSIINDNPFDISLFAKEKLNQKNKLSDFISYACNYSESELKDKIKSLLENDSFVKLVENIEKYLQTNTI